MRILQAAHIACCRMLGVDPRLLEDLIQNIDEISDPKLRDMILFALKCFRDPQGLTDADYDILRQHGLKSSAIMELIAMSALAFMRISLPTRRQWSRTKYLKRTAKLRFR